MRITVTGASGLIGSKLVEHLRSRGDEVTTLSRNPSSPGAVAWQPEQEPAPAAALSGRDAVVHLAGENVAQRWSDDAKRRIRESRELGTRNLVAGIEAADPRPRVLVSSSAVGYYGPHGDERLDEDTRGRPGLPRRGVRDLGARGAAGPKASACASPRIRTGVVLDQGGGALAKMLPFFKLGVGGPVAGGGQYMPWIHVDDVVGIYLAALDGDAWHGPINASAPEPVTNKAFSKALGRALHRPALAPVPALAIQALYGEMAEIVTKGQRVVPKARARARVRVRAPRPRRGPAGGAQSFVIAVWPLSAASPAISASRGFWRRCHGLRSCHSAFSSLGGIASQMIGPRMERISPVPSPAFSP